MTEQITVPASPGGDLLWQAVRYGIVAGSAALASWVFHDALVTGAVMTFAGAVVALVPGIAAFLWGRWTALINHRNQAAMASMLPDSIATVTQP